MPKSPEQRQPSPENENVVDGLQETSESKELPPEVKEKIMERVQNINEIGTAFSFIDHDYPTSSVDGENSKVESVFKHGILGKGGEVGTLSKTSKEEWLETASGQRDFKSFFNIVGRSSRDLYREEPVKLEEYINQVRGIGVKKMV